MTAEIREPNLLEIIINIYRLHLWAASAIYGPRATEGINCTGEP